jgi:hypothetical protein
MAASRSAVRFLVRAPAQALQPSVSVGQVAVVATAVK